MKTETTVLGDYQEASYLAEVLRGLHSKVAAVITEDEVEAVQFYETVARNRGVWLCFFTDLEDARGWLLGEAA